MTSCSSSSFSPRHVVAGTPTVTRVHPSALRPLPSSLTSAHRLRLLLTMTLLLTLYTCVTLLLTCGAIGTSADIKNAAPASDSHVVISEIVTLNMSTSDAQPSDMQSTIRFFPCVYTGVMLPDSNRADFTIDMPVMLPHKDDDVTSCTQPLRYMNEYNQTYDGAWIAIQESSCSPAKYAYAAASGARGILVYGCPATAPYNCNPELQQTIVVVPLTTATLITITAADGQRIVSYLTQKKAYADANKQVLPKDTLMFKLRSSGQIDPLERAALVAITSKTSMGYFSNQPQISLVPSWSMSLWASDNNTYNPCRQMTAGIWCEGNNIVMINLLYHMFAAGKYVYGLTENIPDEFGAFKEVRYLSFMANLLTGPIGKGWCGMTKLKALWLTRQSYPTALITALPDCEWPEMEDFQVAMNQITALPTTFGNWTKLRQAYANLNQLSAMPDLRKLSKLRFIDLSQNKIISKMPTFHPDAPLEVISFAINYMYGSIPPNIFDNRTSLQIVDLNTNQFNGPLPEFAACTKLQIIDLSQQRDIAVTSGGAGFSGEIPKSWYSTMAQSLTSLSLQANALVCTTNIQTSQMVALNYLDLSYNYLTLLPSQAYPIGSVAGMFFDMVGPSLATLNLAYNKLAGPFEVPDPGLFKSMQKIILTHNKITTFWYEMFSSPLLSYFDISYNALSYNASTNPTFSTGSPNSAFQYLAVQGNPNLSYSTLPAWAIVSQKRVQNQGDKYSCAQLISLNAALQFVCDPEFYQYKHCDCQSGTFGKAPLCSYVPNAASINPFNVISTTDSVVTGSLPLLIEQAGGVASDLLNNRTGDPTNATYAQAFSDSMYGENRLTLGLATSWIIDLTNLYSQDIDSLIAQGDNILQDEEKTPPIYQVSPNDTIPPSWTPVRVVTVRLHLDGSQFKLFDDLITIYEGGADLKGNRVFSLRGSDPKPLISHSDYTSSATYQQKYGTALSKISQPYLVELPVFTNKATIQFQSRSTSGLHFFATYSYDFVCPDGYFYDSISQSTPKCRVNYALYSVDSGIRKAVYAMAGLSLAFVTFIMIVLLVKWEHAVFKAASRSFLLLILFLMEMMSLGALLYAAVPDLHSSSGDAVCIGRAWLTCLPLAGVLSIMLAKNRRLYIIFTTTKLQVRVQKDTDLLASVLIICSIQCALLAIYSGIPLSKPILELGKGSISDKLVTSCSQQSGFMSWIGAEIAFIAALMLPTAYLGFKTRDLPSQYNESSHLQNALILLMFFGVIIIPLDVFIQDSPEASVLIQGLGQAFCCLMLTAIIFGPKLYYSFTTAGKTSANTHTNNNTNLTHSSDPVTPNTGKKSSDAKFAQNLNAGNSSGIRPANSSLAAKNGNASSLGMTTSPPTGTNARRSVARGDYTTAASTAVNSTTVSNAPALPTKQKRRIPSGSGASMLDKRPLSPASPPESPAPNVNGEGGKQNGNGNGHSSGIHVIHHASDDSFALASPSLVAESPPATISPINGGEKSESSPAAASGGDVAGPLPSSSAVASAVPSSSSSSQQQQQPPSPTVAPIARRPIPQATLHSKSPSNGGVELQNIDVHASNSSPEGHPSS